MNEQERWIAEWRQAMAAAPKIERAALDELENHLREKATRLVRSGMNPREAFDLAVTQLGPPRAIASEFRKLKASAWLPVKVTLGIEVAAAALLAIALYGRFGDQGARWLLAAHVFTLTLGYVTVLFGGTLGLWFVCRRCFSDLPEARVRPFARAGFLFSCMAAALTAVGIGLGMAWARTEWGRYWAWEPRETAALGVLVWSVCLLFICRLRPVTARVFLTATILGNVVVCLAWLGPVVLARAHGYGSVNYSTLLEVVVLSHLAFFLAGLVPAGWLRFGKA